MSSDSTIPWLSYGIQCKLILVIYLDNYFIASLNRIDMYRESGIFSELQKRTINLKNLTNSEQKLTRSYNIENFSLLHFRGGFLLFLMSNSISPFILLIEILIRGKGFLLLSFINVLSVCVHKYHFPSEYQSWINLIMVIFINN